MAIKNFDSDLRVWYYYRLSRDEDLELESLSNQRAIIDDYAKSHNFKVVGESCDDNVSGMHFQRKGIYKLSEQVDNRAIDAVIVKDLSRLGRHRTQTAMFIDYLKEHDVRVLSVTENIDTMDEDDDLIVGFKGIMNDMYAKDIAKKIRAGYHQKQKSGIVIIPPMGYFKDKNTDKIIIVEEEAEIIRKIYDLYLNGYGLKAIAKIMNDNLVKSPQYYQNIRYSKKNPYNRPKITTSYLWSNTTVKRILQNEFYKGTLVCHKSYTSKISHIRKMLPLEERYIHEDAVPAIISKEKWEQVQDILNGKKRKSVRAGSGKPCHRYAGLLKCADCGSSFVCKIRRWKGKPDRYEYTCNGYHRYGIEHCTSHRINEEFLDKLIYSELETIKAEAMENYRNIESDVKNLLQQKNKTQITLRRLNENPMQRKSDQKDILLERIRDKQHAAIYDEMLTACEKDIAAIESEIQAIQDYNVTIKKRKSEIKDSVDLIERIIREGAISDTNLRLLVDRIEIGEQDGKLDIKIILNANFRRHKDCYDEDGNLTERVFVA